MTPTDTHELRDALALRAIAQTIEDVLLAVQGESLSVRTIAIAVRHALLAPSGPLAGHLADRERVERLKAEVEALRLHINLFDRPFFSRRQIIAERDALAALFGDTAGRLMVAQAVIDTLAKAVLHFSMEWGLERADRNRINDKLGELCAAVKADLPSVEDVLADATAWKVHAERADARARDLDGKVERLETALRLCLEELDWQVTVTDRCGDPNYECPLQDADNPDDRHRLARLAARAALNLEGGNA